MLAVRRSPQERAYGMHRSHSSLDRHRQNNKMAYSLAIPSYPTLARIIPFALYIALLAAEPTLVLGVEYASDWDTRWLYGVRVAIVAIALGVLWRSYDELRLPQALSVREGLYAVSVGLLVFVAWINLDHSLLTFGSPTAFDPTQRSGQVDFSLTAVRWLGAALVVPVTEELFWRSFLMRWLKDVQFQTVKPSSVTLWPLLVVAGLFAVEHHLWFAGLIAGLAYAWLYIRTEKLWVPIIAHAVTNGALGIWVVATRQWHFW